MSWSDPQVQASILTSSVALGVAVVGVLATGRATKKAHEQTRERFGVEASERLRQGHLEDRKKAYAQLLSAVSERADALVEFNEVTAEVERLKAHLPSADSLRSAIAEGAETADELGQGVADALEDYTDALERRGDVLKELLSLTQDIVEALQLVRLLAPEPTRDAALVLATQARDGENTGQAEAQFIGAVRQELGVDLPDHTWLRTP